MKTLLTFGLGEGGLTLVKKNNNKNSNEKKKTDKTKQRQM